MSVVSNVILRALPGCARAPTLSGSEHYPVVGTILIEAIAAVAGDEWDDRFAAAWGDARRRAGNASHRRLNRPSQFDAPPTRGDDGPNETRARSAHGENPWRDPSRAL
ncbi:MAG: hypothetical protein WAU41_10650, partial [Gaiellaceae bacterium]